jgi:hypothetical protein
MPIPNAPLRSLSAYLFIVISVACALYAEPPAEPRNTNELDLSFQCRYRATAYITFFTIPILSRSRVGFGFADADEHMGSATQKISLRFLAGSTPERAHGLNRFGFIQEKIEQRNQATISADYVGLITANKEESLSEGRAALNAGATGEVPVTAVQAFMNQERSSYTTRQMLVPSSDGASSADQFLKQVQAEFAEPGQKDEKTESFGSQAAGTFLNCLRQAILTAEPAYQSRIVFNGNLFRFQAGKHPDPKTGADLRKEGLTPSPDLIIQLSATLTNEKTNEVTNFRLWFEKGAANFLPLRFEFKAKPYLRLVFDQEPAAAQQLTANREAAP